MSNVIITSEHSTEMSLNTLNLNIAQKWGETCYTLKRSGNIKHAISNTLWWYRGDIKHLTSPYSTFVHSSDPPPPDTHILFHHSQNEHQLPRYGYTPQRTTYMLSSRGYICALESPHMLCPVSQCRIWKTFQCLMYVKSCSLGNHCLT